MCAAVAVVLAAAVSCCNKAPKVTALVAGPEAEPVALVVDYGAPVSAESVSPETFVVPGREVACVAICEGKPCEGKPCEAKPCDNPAGEPCAKPADENCHKCKAEEPGCCKEKPCCKEGKPSCPKAESGNTVIVFLKGACPEKHCEAKPCDKPDGEPCAKPADEKCDKCKDGEKCAKPAEEQCDKCKDGEKCAKPAEEQCDKCKDEAEAKSECKKECDKKDGKCELTVPEISIRQVAPLTTADGKEIKPWKKDAKATAVAPAPRPHHHGECHKN